MLTVKVHQPVAPGSSKRQEDIFAAYRVSTCWNDQEQIVNIHTCNDDCYKFPVTADVRIYVENLAKETVQVYKYNSQPSEFRTKEK